jgi:hypothetical protein
MNKPAIPLSDELVEGLDRLRGEQDTPQDLTTLVEAAVREYLEERGISTAPRGLRITPAEIGSGLTDVSLDHDRYLAG